MLENIKGVSVDGAFQDSDLLRLEVKADVAVKGILAEERLIGTHRLHKSKPLIVNLEVWSELPQVPEVSYRSDDAGMARRQQAPWHAVHDDNPVSQLKLSQCVTEPANCSLLNVMMCIAAQQIEESGKTREIRNQQRRIKRRVRLDASFKVFSNCGKIGHRITPNCPSPVRSPPNVRTKAEFHGGGLYIIDTVAAMWN